MTQHIRPRLRRLIVWAVAAAGVLATAALATSATAGTADEVAPLVAIDAPGVDWSTEVVESNMKRHTPADFGGWGYTQGLFLYGQYLVFQRTHNPKYLAYIRSWADRFVKADGSISNGFNNLDSMNSGNVLLALYKETGQAKYRTAATKIRNRLKIYPRTSEGGFWHGASGNRDNQLWGDGVFMVLPFLVRYGNLIGEAGYTADEATKQLMVYYRHLLNPANGLLKHAWDESKKASWANKTTGQSPETWCRAEGWFGMAAIEVLENIPQSHPNRPAIVRIVRDLANAYVRFQDPKSGRWFQVVDKQTAKGNFTETSCSMMYTYVISRAVERGYVAPSLKAAATKGYQGVLARVSRGSNGLTDISEICVGTNVGDLAFYLARDRKTNDLHGLGAFLIMNEQLARTT
jgi:unsaturated rhamnogalacturonyl hydrolase